MPTCRLVTICALIGLCGCGKSTTSTSAPQPAKDQPGSEKVSRDVPVAPQKAHFQTFSVRDGSRWVTVSAESQGGDKFDYAIYLKEDWEAFHNGGPAPIPQAKKLGITKLEPTEMEFNPGDYLVGALNTYYHRPITVTLRMKVRE